MGVDASCHWLVTGDVDGLVKVWDISEYCLHSVEKTTVTPPRESLSVKKLLINIIVKCSIDFCDSVSYSWAMKLSMFTYLCYARNKLFVVKSNLTSG